MPKILLVDDDPQSLESTGKILELAGHAVTHATDGQSALELVRKPGAEYDLVVTDVRMPRLGGLEFLRALSLCGDATPVILMTAFGRVEDAVWAMKIGAVDFLTKPFKRQQLLTAVDATLKRVQARRPAAPTTAETGSAAALSADTARGEAGRLVGESAPMRELRSLIDRVAPTAATVLITGESGTGKELISRRIHARSPRASAPFIAINCAAMPEQLIESELFGFEKGAFTGATVAKEGLFEAAHRGTLLLDEVGDMPLSLQAKLLRVLQESEVRRVGSTRPIHIDVRVIAATHRDLKEAVRAGAFREDLLYRLEVVGLQAPRLRDRLDDLPELVRHFLAQAARRHRKPAQSLSDEAWSRLRAHAWPGNVRELSNVVERAVVFCRGTEIGLEDLPAHLAALSPERALPSGGAISVPFGTSLRDVEELLIRRTLEATDGDKQMTARLLGINSRTIYRKLEQPRKPEGAHAEAVAEPPAGAALDPAGVVISGDAPSSSSEPSLSSDK
jgi:DNA-binding NtrC family response regulator